MSSFEDIADSLNEVSDKEVSQLGKLASILMRLMARKAALENELEMVKGDIRRIEEGDIPALMTELRMKKFVLEDGSTVTVGPFYSASISQDRKDEAFKWLDENGFGDLIKNTVTTKFGKGEDALAEQLVSNLESQGYTVDTAKKVEPMTLKAWVREQYEKGTNIPTDLFGIYVGQRASIKKG